MTDTDWADVDATILLGAIGHVPDVKGKDLRGLASALRAAFLRGRVAGLREAAEIAERDPENLYVATIIRAAADKLEKGEADAQKPAS